MLPPFVTQLLWSYDIAQLDVQKHKAIIIAAVLNFGSKQATDWLFQTYGKTAIQAVARQIPTGAWNKKSLALWQLVLDFQPKQRLAT